DRGRLRDELPREAVGGTGLRQRRLLRLPARVLLAAVGRRGADPGGRAAARAGGRRRAGGVPARRGLAVHGQQPRLTAPEPAVGRGPGRLAAAAAGGAAGGVSFS